MDPLSDYDPCELGLLTAKLTIPVNTIDVDAPLYDGPYVAIPKANDDQILDTKDKYLNQNITIKKVPYYEVDNGSDGRTSYIAEEV